MIAIVNTVDITEIELNQDWTIIEYDSNNIDGSSLAAISYSITPPDFAVQLLTETELEHYKTTAIWRAE